MATWWPVTDWGRTLAKVCEQISGQKRLRPSETAPLLVLFATFARVAEVIALSARFIVGASFFAYLKERKVIRRRLSQLLRQLVNLTFEFDHA